MKKFIIAIIATLFLLIVGNFALWFFNTNAISKSLQQLKETLAKDDLIFEYKEVRYDSFKSWNIQGVIDEPALKAKIIGTSFGISTPRMEFTSRPFEDQLSISMPGDHLAYQFADKFLNHHSDVKLQFDPTSPPEIRFSFNKSLSELVPLIKENNKNIFTTLKSITLDVKHITILDAQTNMVEQTADNFMFDLQFASPKALEYTVNSIIKFTNSRYNQQYVDSNPKETRELIKLVSKQGASNYSHDLNVSFKEDEAKNLTALRVVVKEYNSGNDAFKIEAKGSLDYKKGEPLLATDLEVNVRNYLALLDLTHEYLRLNNKGAYASLYNNLFSDDKLKILKGILIRFSSTDGKDLILDFKTQNNEFRVCGKTITEILTMFQPLLVEPATNGKAETKEQAAKPKANKSQQPANTTQPQSIEAQKNIPAPSPSDKQLAE